MLSLRLTRHGAMNKFFGTFFLVILGYLIYFWHRDIILSQPGILDTISVPFGTDLLGSETLRPSMPTFRGPLRTQGRHIVDSDGQRFKLISINWYGGSDELFIPGGLDKVNRSLIAETIYRMGFNSVRLPYSDEMVVTNPEIPKHLVRANPDLKGLRALEVFEAVVSSLTEAGLAVIINNHITSAKWCCGADLCNGLVCRSKIT
jgi:endoglucanase